VLVSLAGSVDVLSAELVVALASGLAVAIAPPALPMKSPEESTQIPAARRNCVEMRISSRQQGSPSVWNRCLLLHAPAASYHDLAVNHALLINSKPFLREMR
jgi:hypothetical protein